MAGGVEIEVLAGLQLRIDAEEVRHVAEVAPDAGLVGPDRGAADPGLAANLPGNFVKRELALAALVRGPL